MAGLYPNTPFTDGTVFTPDLADLAFEAPIFDDQPGYKGHRERILDSELSNNPGQIKDRLRIISDGLKPSVSSGLTVAYASGTVALPSGDLLAIASGLIVVPNNATSFIWVNNLGTLETGAIPPAIRALVARVVTVSGSITTLQDLRFAGVQQIVPVAASVKVFGGSNVTDKTATNGEVFDQGYYYFRNFNIPAGITITVDKQARFFCAGDVTISGTINVTPIANGAAVYGTPSLDGVNIGGIAGTGYGAGSGSTGTGIAPYPYTAQPGGSGGGGGVVNGVGSVNIAAGGAGGGSLWIEAAGTVTVTGTINANGQSASGGSILSGTNLVLSGSGGGSGGLIYLSSLMSVTCTGTAVLNAYGGAGSAAFRGTGSTRAVNGGGGGGGGWIVLASPSNNTTGAVLNTLGGAAGNTIPGDPSRLGGGMGGAFGGAGGYGGGTGTPVGGGAGRFLSLSFVPIGS